MQIHLIWTHRSVPMAAGAQRRGFPTQDVRNGVYGDGGYDFSFTPPDREFVQIDLLNLDPIFSECDELQERRVIFLFVGVGPTDPSLDVSGSRRPRQDPEGRSVW